MKLLGQLRAALRLRHYSRRTEEAYVGWVRRFVRFCGMRHPADLGAEDVRRVLTSLGPERVVAGEGRRLCPERSGRAGREGGSRSCDDVAPAGTGSVGRAPAAG